jgi:hypothetical protein
MKLLSKKSIGVDNIAYYDLTISPTHTYVLGNGAVVHNCGVGYSVKQRHVSKLPIIPGGHPTKRVAIPDSAEGWADSLIQLFDNPQREFEYKLIRKAGTPLSTGGTASGPNALIEMHAKVRSILLEAAGRKLTSFEVHRIACLIADCVVVGGVRRAALICLFDYEDKETMFCKSFGWWEKYPELARANNSCHLLRSDPDIDEKIAAVVSACYEGGQAEPGLMLTNDLDWGMNPCVRGDTVLRTDKGEETIASVVKRVESGEKVYVLSRNLDTKTDEYNEVTAGALTRKSANVITITLEDGKSIVCTPDHLIYTNNRGYVKAANLTEDDDLVTETKQPTRVKL